VAVQPQQQALLLVEDAVPVGITIYHDHVGPPVAVQGTEIARRRLECDVAAVSRDRRAPAAAVGRNCHQIGHALGADYGVGGQQDTVGEQDERAFPQVAHVNVEVGTTWAQDVQRVKALERGKGDVAAVGGDRGLPAVGEGWLPVA
jgi:hypothetical protein